MPGFGIEGVSTLGETLGVSTLGETLLAASPASFLPSSAAFLPLSSVFLPLSSSFLFSDFFLLTLNNPMSCLVRFSFTLSSLTLAFLSNLNFLSSTSWVSTIKLYSFAATSATESFGAESPTSFG